MITTSSIDKRYITLPQSWQLSNILQCDTFSRSSEAVFELSMRFAEPFTLSDDLASDKRLETERLMFLELTQVCLWGNSTDLSLLINMTEDQIKALQSTGGDHLAATEKNILGNHLNDLWNAVKDLGDKEERRIDFVLDNAGFELYCDCVYGKVSLSSVFVCLTRISADFLLQSGLATQIRFHGKRYPWFVSDVTKKDWEWLLNTLVYGQLFPKASEQERESLRRLGQRWKVCTNTTYGWHLFLLTDLYTAIRKGGKMGLRAASILVYRLHLLGSSLGGA